MLGRPWERGPLARPRRGTSGWTKHGDRPDIRAAAMRGGLLRRFGLRFPDVVEGLPTELPVLEVRTQ